MQFSLNINVSNYNSSSQSSGTGGNLSTIRTYYGLQPDLISLATLTILLNVLVLIVLFRERNLRTPFNVYIIVILGSNAFYLGTHNMMNIFVQEYRYWWLGNYACTFDLYLIYIVSAITLHAHVLVSVNRVWALFWPMSYKGHHTSKLAWLLCLGMVVYLHILVLPGLILDALYYRLPIEKGCWVNRNAQWVWTMFVTHWVFNIPKLIIPVFYPILLWKKLHRRVAPFAQSSKKSGNRNTTEGTVPISRRQIRRSQPFVLLTLFSISVTICWLPSAFFYTLSDYIPVSQLQPLFKLGFAVYPLQALLDPVFFCLSIGNLQNHVCSFWRTYILCRKL